MKVENLRFALSKRTKWQHLRLTCAKMLNVTTKTMYYISLPTEDSHQGHPTGAGTAVFAQRVNDKVAIKISELVADGVTESDKVRSIL